MTVKELIEELQKHDPDIEILQWYASMGTAGPRKIARVVLRQKENGALWDSPEEQLIIVPET